jgi:hypothetical protein
MVGDAGALSLKMRELAPVDPEKVKRLLRGAWGSHLRDYCGNARGEQKVSISQMIALAVLDAYFEESGDWSKMIARLEQKLKEL